MKFIPHNILCKAHNIYLEYIIENLCIQRDTAEAEYITIQNQINKLEKERKQYA